MTAAAISAAEFAAAMGRLGPWDAGRRVAVAVSGGPDSLALAVLAQGWGDPVALIVDHGLRASSAAEADSARAALAARGMPATVLTLTGLRPGPALAERAREARYAALAAACRELGLVDLLLGHHAGDQAETVLLRRRAGSGPRGLAAMAALTETTDLRLLRPLLGVPPERLAAVVAASGLKPVDDPSNRDPAATRTRLRREIGTARAALLAEADAAGRRRMAQDGQIAAELAFRVQFHPAGFAILSPGPISAEALAAVLRTVSGRRYPAAGVAGLAADPRPSTLAGVRILPAGRLGPGWLLVREAAAMAGAEAAMPGAVWDGRFRVAAAPERSDISALGDDAAVLGRRSGLPSAALRTLPAIRGPDGLPALPHLRYVGACDESGATPRPVVHSAAVAAAGAPFAGC